MVGCILTGHGRFADGLASAIAMVAGEHRAFATVSFEDERAATYRDELRAAITEMRAACSGVLVCVDLLGGTPFNEAMMIATEVEDVEVVTGANLPMMIELLLNRDAGASMAELVAQAVTVGQEGITHHTPAELGGGR